jgi:Ca-activated chloride channel homolog
MVKLIAASMFRYIFRSPGNILEYLRSEFAPELLYMVLAGVLLLPACYCMAQARLEFTDPNTGSEKPAATLKVSVNEVDLSFLVTDRHHHWITDLSENEVRLHDNGKTPESIRFFQSRTGLPLRVGLLLDTSDSVAQEFAFEREAAALFISQIIDPARDLAFVVGFNKTISLTQDFTSDRQALASAVLQLHPHGTTAVYDAVDFACQKLLQHPEEGLSRRMLVVLTDGDDNSSVITPDQLMEDAIRCDAVVVVLHTESLPIESLPEYKILRKLTSETGGQILRADSSKHIAKAFTQLTEELRSYYLLAYRPAEFSADGSYRKIELKTTRRGAHVICRRGYYAVKK